MLRSNPASEHLSKLIPLLIIVGVLSAASARATTYFVGTGGSDSNTGTTSGSRWATLAKANARLTPGDVVIVADGVYTDFPRPVAAATADRRITYVGNLKSPSSVIIAAWSSTFNANNVTLKGFNFVNDLNLAGVRDSIAWCVLNGGRPQINGANDCVIANSTINSQRFWFVGAESDTTKKSQRDTISNCVFNLNPVGGGGHTIRLRSIQDGVIERCRFVINTGPAALDASPLKLFFVRRMRFVDNSWDITTGCMSGCDEAGLIVLRDYTQFNTFLRDTILLRGPGDSQLLASGSGTYSGTVMGNRWEGCVIKQIGPGPFGAAMAYQNSVRSDTLKNCVIVGRGSAWQANSVDGQTLVENCTMVGMDPWRGVMGLEDSQWPGQLILRSNIFYARPGAQRVKEAAPLFGSLASVSGHLVSNHNLFYSGMSKDTAIYAYNVGPSAPGVGKPWCVKVRADSNSTWGSPRFTNSSGIESFDAHIESASAAIGAGWGGRDAGAYPFSGVDATPPAPVADLESEAVYDSVIQLTWTAPGDDGLNGQASAYDLRRSTQPITAANFASAIQVPNVDVPDPPGSTEHATLFGLAPGVTYYLALKTRDSTGNWSTLSNIPVVVTNASDVTPPAAIRDLNTSTP